MQPRDAIGATGVRRIAGTAAVLLVSLVVMGGFFYWQTVGFLTRQIDSALLADARSFARETRPALIARLERSLATDLRDGKAYAIFAPDGQRISGNIVTPPAEVPSLDRPASLRVSTDGPGQPRTERVRLVTERLEDGTRLLMGRSARSIEEVREIVTHAMVLAVLPALGVSLLGALVVGRSTSRRIHAVRQACQAVMLGAFDKRLPVRGGWDEFDRLSAIVNAMLAEIERLVAEVKGAGDAVAHDLRTPLTRLHARLERAANRTGDPEARAALGKALGEVDGLLITVQALMRIAEVEQSRRRANFSLVDLDALVETIVEFYQPIAEEKDVSFGCTAEPGLCLDGDGDLLFEALANLADNAVKFTPEGGRAGIAVTAAPDGLRIAVWDTGTGVPADERDNVLRRFYRLDHSRQTPGAGLGLSLVAAVARLHQFSIDLTDNPGGGLRVELFCPRPAQA